MKEVIALTAGVTTTWSAGFIAFCVTVTPILQVAALLVSIGVGVLTAVWTWKKINKQ